MNSTNCTSETILKQIDSKPYTVWNLTPKGWIIITPYNMNGKIQLRSVRTMQLKNEEKRSINLI